MNKKLKILFFILILITIGFLIYFSFLNCGSQGKRIDLTNSFGANECCKGLKDVNSQDSISIADECYWVGTESGSPIAICSNCGNGICEDVEGVCSCSQDCAGKGNSDYNTVQEFCSEGYARYCNDLPDGFELDLCNLC